MGDARYYVQSETIRGEPRVHWVAERGTGRGRMPDKEASVVTTNLGQAQRWCDKLNASSVTATESPGSDG